jgi:hypothetical protein
MLALKHGFGQHVWNFDVSTILEDIKKCVQVCLPTLYVLVFFT